MAIYGTYTDKQQAVLDDLTKRAARAKKMWDDAEQKLMDKPVMDFDENRITRKRAREKRDEYERLTAEINDILNARKEYEMCIEKTKSYLSRAETLKGTWGF